MITVDKLTKHYGPVTAVSGISFEVKKGEVLGFLGPNGAGKTTTMKIITGYLSPSAGRTLVNGLDCAKDPMAVKKLIGYVPESFPLYEDMAVAEYLLYIARIRDIPGPEVQKRVKDIVGLCGLGEVVAKDISQLSRGFRQRVGLAQAIIHDPEFLILDEPTSGLDPNQIVEIRNLIKRLGQEKTVILSTHILPEVTATCNRVIIINNGSLVADGTPSELLERGQSSRVIRVEFAKNYEGLREALGRVDFVEKVKPLDEPGLTGAAFEVESGKSHDIRAKLFELAVSRSWTLLELHSEMQSLEDVFRSLTK